MKRRLRTFLRMTAYNAVISAAIIFTFSGVTLRTPWPRALEAFGIAFLFAWCIAPLCFVVLPRVAPTAFTRLRFPWNWAVVIATMLGLATGGSLLALVILTVVGYIEGSRIFLLWLGGALKVSVVVTLTVGIAVTAVELIRGRLERATLALRTKERDEAEARRLAAEAQLAALESRVEPHFLFNTLNSIASLIPTDPKGAEKMTGQLASLIRSSLDSRRPLIPLEDELQMVRDYLEIERVRFGERLRYDVLADAGAAGAMVPRLALQTLVENAVKYAVSARREGGTIAVRVRNGAGRVRLEVQDDGPGFDAAGSPAGHGLALIRSRLALTYGDRAALTIQSRPGRTVAAIEIPRPTAEDAEDAEVQSGQMIPPRPQRPLR